MMADVGRYMMMPPHFLVHAPARPNGAAVPLNPPPRASAQRQFIRNSSAPGSPITLADTTCTFVDVSASGDQVVAMESVRSISASYSTLSGPPIETKKGTVTTPFAYRFEFLFYDGATRAWRGRPPRRDTLATLAVC